MDLAGEARVHERILGKTLAMLEEHEVFEVDDLVHLEQLPAFDACFSSVTATTAAKTVPTRAGSGGAGGVRVQLGQREGRARAVKTASVLTPSLIIKADSNFQQDYSRTAARGRGSGNPCNFGALNR